jgi:hypothetical protein
MEGVRFSKLHVKNGHGVTCREYCSTVVQIAGCYEVQDERRTVLDEEETDRSVTAAEAGAEDWFIRGLP